MKTLKEYTKEKTIVDKKDLEISYGKHDLATQIKYKGKVVNTFYVDVPSYSKVARKFDWSPRFKRYISSFRTGEIDLDKEVFDDIKGKITIIK